VNKKSQYAVLLILLCFTSHLIFSQDEKSVRVAVFNYYPAIFQDTDGIVKGFYVDILDELGRNENIHFEYVFGTWLEGLDRIKSGEVDLLTSVAFTEERAEYMDYSRNPLLTVWGELYTLQSSDIDSIGETESKKIGVMKNDFNSANFIDLTSKFGIECTYIEFDSSDHVFQAINDGQVDCGVANVVFGSAKQLEYGLRSTGIIFNPFNIYFTVAKNKNGELLSILDTYLDEWKYQKDSVFISARQKWTRGSTGFVEVFPEWLIYFFIISGIIIVLAFIFILLLRFQVKKVSLEYRESEEIFRQFLKYSPVYVFFKDSSLRVQKLSENYRKMLGKSENEIIGKTMNEILLSDFSDNIEVEEKNILNAGQVVTLEEEFKGRKYSTIKFSFKNIHKEQYLAGFMIDVTERRNYEENIKTLLAEKELLLIEVHHRIKNNMTTIKGLLTMQIAAEQNPLVIESLRDAENRVQSIIILYDKLFCTDNYRELNIREYILPLVEDIINGFPNSGIIKKVMEIEDFILNIRILSPLGIIINELLTNIMKHAFIGRQSGLITVNASMKDNYMIITVSDDGIGLPENMDLENSVGFGMQIVQMLTDQLDGSMHIERNEGTKFIMKFEV
jgi:PAS domain S-box-containing protein